MFAGENLNRSSPELAIAELIVLKRETRPPQIDIDFVGLPMAESENARKKLGSIPQVKYDVAALTPQRCPVGLQATSAAGNGKISRAYYCASDD